MSASKSLNLVGSTGRNYLFKKLLQERPYIGRVWLASSGNDQFILKDIPENIFAHFNKNIQPQLSSTPHIRLPLDTIPDQRIFVYEYLDDDFLNLVGNKIPVQARKKILKAALQGIAYLHDHDIVHLDIKPDNIMINYRRVDQDVEIKKVQVIDFENAAHLPKPYNIKGMLPGNGNWRAPEGYFRKKLNRPTDMFSFGLVCIYAILGRVILGRDDVFELHESKGMTPMHICLQRQVSYFGDIDGLVGLMNHVEDEQDSKLLGKLWEYRVAIDLPYRPFAEWPDIDPLFKDLIRGLNNLDLSQRLTAHQALDHPWFKDI